MFKTRVIARTKIVDNDLKKKKNDIENINGQFVYLFVHSTGKSHSLCVRYIQKTYTGKRHGKFDLFGYFYGLVCFDRVFTRICRLLGTRYGWGIGGSWSMLRIYERTISTIRIERYTRTTFERPPPSSHRGPVYRENWQNFHVVV